MLRSDLTRFFVLGAGPRSLKTVLVVYTPKGSESSKNVSLMLEPHHACVFVDELREALKEEKEGGGNGWGASAAGSEGGGWRKRLSRRDKKGKSAKK